jgi:hypothetical protein
MDISNEYLESIFSKQWREATQGWHHQAPHNCSMERCNIERVVGGIWRNDTETHICVRTLCPDHPSWANRGTLKRQIHNVYMCCATGSSHWCDEQCRTTYIDHSDGGYVCMISGIRYESIKSDTWFAPHQITATQQEMKDPLKLVRNTNFKVDENSTETIRRQQHLYVSEQQIQSILFSDERLYMEQRKYVEMRHEAEKVVQKYIKSCEKKGQITVFTHIVQLYINQMNRRHIFRNLLPTKQTKESITEKYAKAACDYWSLITRRLPLGIQTPALFPIKIFTISILYIMKGGLSLGGVWVIPTDPYLASVLPEANTLDSYQINKPAFTQCKNNILKGYRESSELYQINPLTLVLNS